MVRREQKRDIERVNPKNLERVFMYQELLGLGLREWKKKMKR